MNNQQSARKILLIYFLTMLGSSLTTVVSFLSVETVNPSGSSVNNALAIRTLGFVLFSYLTPALLNKFGEKLSLIFAQAFGLIALLVLFVGFHSQEIILVYLGIMLTGLPSNITATGLLASLRSWISNPDQFRFYSSRRELIGGLTLSLAGFLSPILISHFGIEKLLFFDGLTYIFAILFLSLSIFPQHVPSAQNSFPHWKEFSRPEVFKFILVVSGSLALMATLPLIASSTEVRTIIGLDSHIFKSLWGIEGFVAIVASYLYPKMRKQKYALTAVHLNAWPLLAVGFVSFFELKFILLSLVPICFTIVFLEARDTLIISAKDDKRLVNNYIAITSLIRSAWGTLSPYILYDLFRWLGLLFSSLVLLAIQSLELLWRGKKT